MRVPCAFSCSKEFLDLVDARAAELMINRSQYVTQTLRNDILKRDKTFSVSAGQAAVYGGIINNHSHLKVAERHSEYKTGKPRKQGPEKA